MYKAVKEFFRVAEKERKKRGLSVERLAELVGVSARQYQNYIYGRAQPLFGTALRLAAVLEIDLNSLCDLQDEQTKQN